MIDEKKHAAEKFVERWTAAEGNEQREANSFWTQLLEDVLGINNPTRVLAFERKAQGRRIDIFYEDMGILIENKSRGVDLDTAYERGKDEGGDKRMVTPYEQAKWYADNLPRSISPRWIILCNFDTFRIHDLDLSNPKNDYVEVQLSELPQQYQLFSFFTDQKNSRLIKEQELSVKAGETVGRLYQRLSSQYKNIETDEHEQKSLNVLIVRLVFLLYAEDADLLHERDAFLNYMRTIPTASMRNSIIDLFKVLDTKPEDRDPYLDEKLLSFPYINGGLFAQEDILIPQFTEDIRLDLLLEASQQFNWREISPTIFGAVFESTLNPETRRSGGMHYTSIENIHKVIDPLFLDDLKQELADIEGERVAKNRKIKLLDFQKKLAGLNIFDPACGSGNFLTESYLSLRKLENRIIEDLQGIQIGIGFEGDIDPILVHISQFYGIEINDFAVSVAKTALWIAEEQAMEATQEIILKSFDFLPLKTNANIREGNALRIDWNEVIPAERCSYICGNPPFVGGKLMSKEQRQEIVDLFGRKVKLVNSIDYVSGWYYKAAEMMQRKIEIEACFVSTNSICQGQQVAPIWKTIKERFGICFNFAYRSFIWDSEAADQAHVHVVIIGFSRKDKKSKRIYSENSSVRAERINPYLFEASEVVVSTAAKPISINIPACVYGSLINDGGQYIFKEDEAKEFLKVNPIASKYMRKFTGSDEFINNRYRYILYLKNVTDADLLSCPELKQRIENVKQIRLSSTAKPTRESANRPNTFYFDSTCDGTYLIIPSTSSERRKYVPVGFMPPDVVTSNGANVVPDATSYHYGVIQSQFHNAWMRVVAGRLKSDYRYSPKVVYNTFVWPEPTDEQRVAIETCAQAILDTRDSYPNKSLADLYDPDKMPNDLLAAHKTLDSAVEAAYSVDFNGDEEKIVAYLFKLYAEATKGGSDA